VPAQLWQLIDFFGYPALSNGGLQEHGQPQTVRGVVAIISKSDSTVSVAFVGTSQGGRIITKLGSFVDYQRYINPTLP
jgi:hypothetical protein